FEDSKIAPRISVVRDGKQAIDFLSNSKLDMPDLLLLDINLPKKNGIEVLQFVKSRDNIKHVAVIVLTTSSSERDIYGCYKNYVQNRRLLDSNREITYSIKVRMVKDKGSFSILVIEDNPGDYLLVEEYLSDQILNPYILNARTFAEARTVLSKGAGFDVVLL